RNDGLRAITHERTNEPANQSTVGPRRAPQGNDRSAALSPRGSTHPRARGRRRDPRSQSVPLHGPDAARMARLRHVPSRRGHRRSRPQRGGRPRRGVAQSGVRRGDLVQGLFGWQDYARILATGPGKPTKLVPGVPIPLAMSALGMTGITAYFGLLDVGRPKAGETVVVSGAAGATGSIVGQIARIKGCRTVGIAGGKAKCDWLVGEAKFDAAIDYKSEKVGVRRRDLSPDGIDVYFDSGGGELLDLALARLAMRGRVVLCGAIAAYNDTDLRPGPKN